ncbi:MAG: hypothetical protein IPP27_18875 [Bacteroidetes bacterium]|nr:hypothetical protein [Bacteroidota bacterium]
MHLLRNDDEKNEVVPFFPDTPKSRRRSISSSFTRWFSVFVLIENYLFVWIINVITTIPVVTIEVNTNTVGLILAKLLLFTGET